METSNADSKSFIDINNTESVDKFIKDRISRAIKVNKQQMEEIKKE